MLFPSMLPAACVFLAAANPRVGLGNYTRTMAETMVGRSSTSTSHRRRAQQVELLQGKLGQRYSANLCYQICTTVHDFSVAYVRFYQLMYLLRFLDFVSSRVV